MLPMLAKGIGLIKKVFLVIIVYTVVISLLGYFITKDKPQQTIDPLKKNREEIYKIINDKKINSTKQGRFSISVYRLFYCGFIGEACTDNPDDADKNFNHSISGFMTNLIVLPYANPPASAVYWVYSGLENSGFVPKTYAAEGIGFAALKPFMNIWKAFRDLAYSILVLVLIAIGFMIMFRMKLNPQTVISVEAALPKIVISLILITFSFPLAGLMIDLMYVILAISISVLSWRGNFFNPAEFINKYVNSSSSSLLATFWPQGAFKTLGMISQAIINILPQEINQILRSLLGIIGAYGFIRLFNGPIGHIADAIKNIFEGADVEGSVVGTVGFDLQAPGIGGIVRLAIQIMLWLLVFLFGFQLGYTVLPLVLSLLIICTVILLLFRIFFLLFATYIKIILMIIFSPLFLLFEAIPGKSAFSYWFKNLFAEILTFPIVVILLVTGYLITNTTASTGIMWRPPFLGGFNPNALTVLIGTGIVFMIPELVKITKEFMGVKGLPVSIGLGTFFAGAGTAVGGGMGLVSQFSSIMLAFPGLRSKLAGKNKFLGSLLEQQTPPPKPPAAQTPATPAGAVPPGQNNP